MFKLAIDARILNMLANDSTILPHIAPDGIEAFDFAIRFRPEWIERTRFYHNGADDSDMAATIGLFFEWTSPEIWALHMMAKPEARGRDALSFAIAAMTDMFEHRADQIWGEAPGTNKRVGWIARKLGGVSRGVGTNPLVGKVEYFVIRKADWQRPTEPK